MLEQLIAGETDQMGLAVLAQDRQPEKIPQLQRALAGFVAPHQPCLRAQQLVQLDDLDEAIERVSAEVADRTPSDVAYGHNDFRGRMHPAERPNGHAHCLPMLLGSSESVPVADGLLQLGAWQRLFLVEPDGAHRGASCWCR